MALIVMIAVFLKKEPCKPRGVHFLSIDRFQRGDISQVKKLSLQHDDSQDLCF